MGQPVWHLHIYSTMQGRNDKLKRGGANIDKNNKMSQKGGGEEPCPPPSVRLWYYETIAISRLGMKKTFAPRK